MNKGNRQKLIWSSITIIHPEKRHPEGRCQGRPMNHVNTSGSNCGHQLKISTGHSTGWLGVPLSNLCVLCVQISKQSPHKRCGCCFVSKQKISLQKKLVKRYQKCITMQGYYVKSDMCIWSSSVEITIMYRNYLYFLIYSCSKG